MKAKNLFLPILVAFLLISCKDKSSELNQSATRFKTLPFIESTLSEDMAQLHNQGIYDFCAFIASEGITPFDDGLFTDNVIQTFVQNFVQDNLNADDYIEDYCENVAVVVSHLTIFQDEIFGIYSNQDLSVDDMDDAIIEWTTYYCGNVIGDEETVFHLAGGVARGTNFLWGTEWDFDEHPLIPETYQQAVNDSTSEEQEKEDQQKLKMADLSGAIGGAVGGASGGIEGVLLGALGGAIAASLNEYIQQQLDKVAIVMPEDDVNDISPHSYFYVYLTSKFELDPSDFYEHYGHKFDAILY